LLVREALPGAAQRTAPSKSGTDPRRSSILNRKIAANRAADQHRDDQRERASAWIDPAPSEEVEAGVRAKRSKSGAVSFDLLASP